ncbi:hypothetical protein [Brevundimonas sp. LM2]|uniref:hypothetical protein n=1 Tax=Brevundimonas sp. LM2 TaxID=1938605 RepID=UPI0012375D67|nr:hypothetical protein [Brevundimonas sp. LM2]
MTPLRCDELDDALVLARLGYARFDEAEWRRDLGADATNAGHGSALIARKDAGRPCGLILYRILAVPDRLPVLEIARLVAFDLTQPRPIAEALLDEAVRRARLADCDTLRFTRPLAASHDALALILASGLADLHSVF